jgi:hypothetical protein
MPAGLLVLLRGSSPVERRRGGRVIPVGGRHGRLHCSAAVLAPSRTATPRRPASGFGSGRACGVDLGETADFAGDAEEVMPGVERLGRGVELVEHRADERGLADVLRNADALRVCGQRDRGVGLVSEADRGRV